MQLQFLNLGDYQVKEMHLQHISEMINIKLSAGDTYNTLFRKLEEEFKTVPEKLAAVKAWVAHNTENQSDASVFDTVLCEGPDVWAAFNLAK